MSGASSKSSSQFSSSCDYPLHGWLLGTYVLVGSLRLAFMFYEGAENCIKLTAYVLMILFMPAIISWTVLGTVWYASIERQRNLLECA